METLLYILAIIIALKMIWIGYRILVRKDAPEDGGGPVSGWGTRGD